MSYATDQNDLRPLLSMLYNRVLEHRAALAYPLPSPDVLVGFPPCLGEYTRHQDLSVVDPILLQQTEVVFRSVAGANPIVARWRQAGEAERPAIASELDQYLAAALITIDAILAPKPQPAPVAGPPSAA